MSTRLLAVLLTISVIPVIVIPIYAQSTVPVTETCGHAGCQDDNFSTYWSHTANYPGSITWSTDIMVPPDSTVHVKSAHGGSSSRGNLYQYVQNSQTGQNYCIYPVVQSGSCTYSCSASSCADSATADTTVVVPMSFDRIVSGFSVTWQVGSETFYAYEADVTIHDTTPPVITLLGDNPLTIFTGNDYTELDATCNDDFDGNISSNVVIDSSSVNTSSVGQYFVTYDCADSASNDAVQVTRTVNVIVELVPPTITPPSDIIADATGEQTSLDIGLATAIDNTDPNPAITNNAPDSFPHGITTVTWTATDISGNESTANQIIMVFAEYVQSVEGNRKVGYHEKYEDGTTAIISKLHDSRITTFNCQSLEKTPWNNATDQWVNQTGVGVFHGTFNSTNPANHFRCYDGNGDILFTATSYPDDYNGISLGFDVLNDAFGEDGGILGVPVFVMFVIAVASMATRNNAPDFVIIILAIIGIGGVLGMMVIDDALWGLLLAIGAIVVLVGRKLYT